MHERLQLDPDPGLFYDLLDEQDELSLARLIDACQREDVELAVVPDEVLLLCGQNPDADPQSFWQPWLRRDDVDTTVARATALRYLATRGLVDVEDLEHADGELPFVLRQPLVTLQWALGATTGLLTYEIETFDEPSPEVGGAFVLPDDLVLHDHQDADHGLHRLVFRDLEVELAWLAGFLDPAGCAGSADEPVVAATAQELRARVGDLPGEHRSRTMMASAGWVEGVEGELAVTTFGTTEGLWVLQARGGPEPVASLQRLGDAEILDVAATLLRLAG